MVEKFKNGSILPLRSILQYDYVKALCGAQRILLVFCCSSSSGKGDCSGATVELALNYVADLTAKKQGGMFRIEDVPYHGSSKTWVECDDVTSGKTPMVGIEGWTKLPGNNYKATMNAVAKVRYAISPHMYRFFYAPLF